MRVEQIRRVVIERLGQEWWGPLGHAKEVETLLRGGIPPYDVVSRQLAGLVDWLASRSRDPARDRTDT